jgi:hypothetical protein
MRTNSNPLPILIFGISLLYGAALQADTWALPRTVTIESNNKIYRFTTTPGQRLVEPARPDELARLRELAKRAELTEEDRKRLVERIRRNEEYARIAKKLPGCKGRLERKLRDGAYELVWQGELTNGIAPVSVLVSDNGKYVVTFDDWHSVGRGPNVVVIYGPKGKPVRQLALKDFLTQQQINGLRRTVSSTWWKSGHSLDEKQECLVLHIVQEEKQNAPGKPGRFGEIRLRLATGAIVTDAAKLESRRSGP